MPGPRNTPPTAPVHASSQAPPISRCPPLRSSPPPRTLDAMSLDEVSAHRSAHLAEYQNAALADRYRGLVKRVRDAATDGGYGDALPRAVAVNYAKLLAYKDEYEVARLFTDGRFEKQLRDQFEGDFKLNFNLAPPILGGGP